MMVTGRADVDVHSSDNTNTNNHSGSFPKQSFPRTDWLRCRESDDRNGRDKSIYGLRILAAMPFAHLLLYRIP